MLSPERTLMHKLSLPVGAAFRIECFEGKNEREEKWKTVDVFLEHPDGTDQLLYTADCSDNTIRSMLFEDLTGDSAKELVMKIRKKVVE